MVHNNKVLTVSYGTFSCTLEGFDDSFGTMKAIAEYFRDLASDDRYFGAEPPQPDAEMLARIAQREITRQVEAHSTDTGGIILRAAQPDPVPDSAIPMARPPEEQPPVVLAEAVIEPAPELAPELAPEPTIEPDLSTTQAVSAPVEMVETTEETAEAVTEEITETISPDPVIEEPALAPPEPAVSHEPVAHVVETETKAEVEDEVDLDVESAAEIEITEVTEVEADVADMAEVEDTIEVETADIADVVPAPKPEPAADSIAAKLQRIRAVVSQNDSLVQSDDYTEDQHADAFVRAAAQDISQALEADEEIHDSPEEQDADTEILQVLNQLDAHDDTQETGGQQDDAIEEVTEIADVFAEDTGRTETETVQFDDQDLVEEVPVDDMITATLSEQAEKPAQAQARVVKVKRADLEAAIATGQLEQIDTPEDDDISDDDIFADHNASQDSSLSPEDEADLMRELAAVEDELLVGDTDGEESNDNIFDEDIASKVADEHNQEEVASGILQQNVGEDEADLSRLMAEADEKLEDPETSSRHETYSQLRAAVAAAEAERSAGGSVEDTELDDAYRDDLAGVVRPRRPARDGTRANRPVADTRPAPLKLVAEQRIDDGTSISQRGPVRPRRVMTVPVSEAGAADTTAADSAFADFAQRVGATELPELLEAAAAYLYFVEGHAKFSRPQLMNKVRLIKQDDFNREDGLRSFGQLLRDGKIKKKGGGRFAASGEIGFQPDEREAS